MAFVRQENGSYKHQDRTGNTMVDTEWVARVPADFPPEWSTVVVRGFFHAERELPPEVVFTSAVSFTEHRTATADAFLEAFKRKVDRSEIKRFEAAAKALDALDQKETN